MHLKELRINGFKSFADSTRLHFDPGVTAFVGPNGCGKSNIADAIRWVLGEQSAKALRGGKMHDVIFEGTDRRKQLHVCDVSLLFADCENHLGLGFNEIEITRRVSRDGQSDYFINGKHARLKDIQRIFMDTGIGRTSYSIMAQGQIDQILSPNPDERRAVFEEAAGITKYKSQRKDALNKLDHARNNLNRLTDVIDEVKRQINSLRRQAGKAVRYKRLRFRLDHLDLAEHAFQFSLLRSSISETEERVRSLNEQLDNQRLDLGRMEAEIERKKAERAQANQSLQEAQQAVFATRSRKEQAENRARLAAARYSDLESRSAEARNAIISIESQLEDIAMRAKGSAEIKHEQSHLVESSDEIFRLRNKELVSIQNQLAQAEQALNQEKNALARYENDVARLRNQTAGIEVSLKSDEMRYASIEREIAEIVRDVEAAAENVALVRESIGRAAAAAERSQAEVSTAQEQVISSRDRFREIQRGIQEFDRAITRNTARLRVIQQLQEKFEGFSDGAKAVLQGKLDHALNGHVCRALTAGVSVPPEFTKPVEMLLGAAVDAVAVASPETALTILELLEQQKLGKACIQFPVTHPVDGGELAPFPRPALSLVDCEDGEDGPHPLLGILHGSYVAESAADFFTFWNEHPDFSFQYVATAKGELIDRRGLVFGGFSNGAAGGILQRANEIQALSADIAEQQKQMKQLRADAEARQELLDEAERVVEAARGALIAANEKRSTLQAEERALVRAQEDVASRLRRIEAEQSGIGKRQENARGDVARLRERLQQAIELFESHKRRIVESEQHLNGLRAEREREREELAEVRVDLAEKRHRLDILARGLLEMEQRRQELDQNREIQEAEIVAAREQLAQLAGERDSREDDARLAAAELELLTTRVEEARASFSALDASINALEKEMHGARSQSEQLQSSVNKLEVQLAGQRSKIEFLQEEARRDYQTELSSIDWRSSLWRADDKPSGKHPLDLDEDEPEEKKTKKEKERGELTAEARAAMTDTDWESIKAEIQALRARIQSMGPVNLVAIEEYSELKDRFNFLTEQSNDLVRAMGELLAAIDDINARSRAQFQEIFDRIRENFIFTFQSLFGGGRADLRLMESEDVLDSGVDIIAQPPGTKLNTLALLSGGQKTMTAVALLFAIYMVKPSPFCVLDELDAPLDEANIGRFTDMLKKFTPKSQFLIITHNKRTISEAHAIFGVTMEEKGVSKVISMRFSREKGQAVAADDQSTLAEPRSVSSYSENAS